MPSAVWPCGVVMLRECRGAHDVAGEECLPEARHVVGGRVQAAVADAAHGDMEHVGLESVAVKVADCRVAGQRVDPEHVG